MERTKLRKLFGASAETALPRHVCVRVVRWKCLPAQRASVAVIMLRQTALRATVLPRTALSRLAARPLCMHDDFKPKIKSYAGDDGDVHAQVRRRRLLVGSMHGLGGPVRAHRSPRTWRRTRWWSS